MVERKLVKQGKNALTITLPANWIKKNNLTGKDYIHIEEIDNSIIATTTNAPKAKTTTINLENLNEQYSYHILSDKYIQGYDIIEITHNNPEIIEKLCSGFIGTIIENLTPTKCTLKNIVETPIDNYENLLKRITQQLLEQTKKLKQYSETKQEKDTSRDDTAMDYNILYAMRYFNKHKIQTSRDKQKNFLILYSLETIGDNIKNLSRYIYSEEQIAAQAIELIETYIKCLHLKDFKTIYAHTKKLKKEMRREKYIDGLFYSLTEIITNYIAYMIEKN